MEDEREFEQLTIRELEVLLDRYHWEDELCERVLIELATRQSRGAAVGVLRGRLMSRPSVQPLQRHSPPSDRSFQSPDPASPASGADTPEDTQDPASSRVFRIRPTGTQGLPEPTARIRQGEDIAIDASASRCIRYCVALDQHIKDIKARQNSRGTRKRTLNNGQRIVAAGETLLYQFDTSTTHDIRDDEEYDLRVQGETKRCTVQEKTRSQLLLKVPEDLGPTVAKAELILDDSKLLEILLARIRAIEAREGEFNFGLADAAVGSAVVPSVTPIPGSATSSVTLNTSQRAALIQALARALTFIWGPPGCGKTLVLGELVRRAFEANKRTLVSSVTNKAVDQVLYSICNALGKEHPALLQGQVLRLGDTADAKLAEEYGDYVIPERVVKRRATGLEYELQELHTAITEVKASLAPFAQNLEQFATWDQVAREFEELEALARQLETDSLLIEARLQESQRRCVSLEAEFREPRSGWRGWFKRSLETVREEWYAETQTHTQLQAEQQKLHAERQATALKILAVGTEYQRLDQVLAGLDRPGLERRVDELSHDLDALETRSRALQEEIAGLRKKILQEAHVLGATAARAYLKPKEIGVLDLVVVDEASMIQQPLIWILVGLSRERAVVCGDFRQLEPIFNTERQSIFDLIGRDVFDAAGLTHLDTHDERMVMLDTQYRMHEAICALISGRMYGGRLQTTSDADWLRQRHQLTPPPEPFDHPLTLIDTSGLNCAQGYEDGSRFNLTHALLVRSLCFHLVKSGYAHTPAALGVCTPYTAQARLIDRLLQEQSLTAIQVGSVHTFQGDERNAIILDFPDSQGAKAGHFLQGISPEENSSRLINVAISRARHHLIVIANLHHLDRTLPSQAILRGVLHDLQNEGRVVPAARLFALGPTAADFAGLDSHSLNGDETARRWGAFDSKSFDAHFSADVARARESVAIFSGYMSKYRVSELRPMLQRATIGNIQVRCVSRPPAKNFPSAPANGAEATAILRAIDCVVDSRAHIHQKVVIIDRRIVWHGSLNVLSFAQRTDELMTRFVSAEAAQCMAFLLSKTHETAKEALEKLTEPENPLCEECQSHTYYDEHGRDRFFRCENRECDWKQYLPDHKQSTRKHHPRPALPRESTSNHASLNAPPPYSPNGPPCPKCNATTVLRKNSYNGTWFYGCSRFSSGRCRGSIAIAAEETRH